MSASGDRKRSPAEVPSDGEVRRSRAAREAMDRAIRRLNLLEFLILGGAAFAAVVGGWLTAWLARGLGVPFRPAWFLASFLLFAVPGVLVWRRDRRSSRRTPPSEETGSTHR